MLAPKFVEEKLPSKFIIQTSFGPPMLVASKFVTSSFDEVSLLLYEKSSVDDSFSGEEDSTLSKS
jgi:hypothetical protein